ncbi:MAG: ZIP family metal transporter [Solirubrobacterales bacterium]
MNPLALVAASVTFFSTMAGGYVAIRWPKRIELLMALAGGVVLAAALVDLLPEAVNQAQEQGLSPRVPIGASLIGYLVFYGAERFVHRHGHSEGPEPDGPDPAGLAGAAGFVVHSFFDGLAIGIGFKIDTGVGLLVAAAVIGHDFSDGLSTVSYLAAHRHPESRSWRFLIADALAPVCGALFVLVVPVPDVVFPLALGFFSGLFIYAATTNLLPAARELPISQALPLTLAGASAMFAVSLFA